MNLSQSRKGAKKRQEEHKKKFSFAVLCGFAAWREGTSRS
jgi:hypothetical protein